MNANMFYAALIMFSFAAIAMSPTRSQQSATTLNIAMSLAQSMLRYHGGALAMKEADTALTGTLSPTIAGLTTAPYTACANANAVATMLTNPGIASPDQVVTDMQSLSTQAPGIGIAFLNRVNVAGTLVALPCAVADGTAVIYTEVF